MPQITPCPKILLSIAAAAAVLGVGASAAADRQTLWGYGVRGCAAYLEAAAQQDGGDATEFQRYEDWLTGFISGLNLATGEDVLRGSGIESAMRRTRAYCEREPEDDFFNASMDFVRALTGLK
jgi:hypothetical protein